jgi:hypothetical protein
MNYLVNTNVFLEILLNQTGRRKCESFLQDKKGAAWISDFTLHSIGVLLFRQKRTELFDKFAADTLSQLTILSLSVTDYPKLTEVNRRNVTSISTTPINFPWLWKISWPSQRRIRISNAFAPWWKFACYEMNGCKPRPTWPRRSGSTPAAQGGFESQRDYLFALYFQQV